MQVRINGDEVEVNAPEGLIVGDLIDALAVHIKPGEVVTEVLFDGMRFVPGDSKLAWRAVQATSDLQVTTVSGQRLGEGLRGDVAAALAVVEAKCGKVGSLLDMGSTAKAQALLGELLEELRLTLVLDAQSAQLAGTAPVTSAHALESVAESLLEAQQCGDREVLGRLLTRDLGPMLHEWGEAFASAD